MWINMEPVFCFPVDVGANLTTATIDLSKPLAEQ